MGGILAFLLAGVAIPAGLLVTGDRAANPPGGLAGEEAAIGLQDLPGLGEKGGPFAVLGDPASSGLPAWPGRFDARPESFDIDGDGVDELIAHSNDTNVYVFQVDTGRAVATLPTQYPSNWPIDRIINGVEAAVLRPGEPVSLIVTNHAADVAVWRFDPAGTTDGNWSFKKVWEQRMDACFPNPGMDASATVADVDGDGVLEILLQTEEVGFYALDAEGATLWKQCWSGGNSSPGLADLDGDGRLEAFFASDDGRISVMDAVSGELQWNFEAGNPVFGFHPASVSVTPAVADLDGRNPLELVFTVRQAPRADTASFPDFHMGIFAVRERTRSWGGELVWLRTPEWANPLSYARLETADVDGDGAVDILGMDWNTIGHKPGNWQRLGPAHAFRLDARGEDVWVRDVDAWWSNKALIVADADGDGRVDILANGKREGADGLWRLAASTGEPEAFLPIGAWRMMRDPALLDVRHDGSTQLALPVAPADPALDRGAILLYDLAASPLAAPP